MDIEEYFYKHKNKYKDINRELDRTREKFEEMDYISKIKALKRSYIHSVISVMTPMNITKKSYLQFLETGDLNKSLKSVNYNNKKIKHIEETLKDPLNLIRVVDAINDGKLNKALKLLKKNFKGISWVKSNFTLAMLGFKQFACIDTNVKQFLNIEHRINSKKRSVNAKKQLNESVRLDIPLFLKQWLVFDYIREEFETHKYFFNTLFI